MPHATLAVDVAGESFAALDNTTASKSCILEGCHLGKVLTPPTHKQFLHMGSGELVQLYLVTVQSITVEIVSFLVIFTVLKKIRSRHCT